MVKDILIGNVTDSKNGTGVTAIIAPKGAVAGVDVRGSASGTREIEIIKSAGLVKKINAVVLAGGSAFGLEASCGVMEELYKQGCGYTGNGVPVPIVSSAILYDLDYKNFAYPDKEMGRQAVRNAKCELCESGSIGAGTGATVGKVLGSKYASKGGLGVFSLVIGDIEVIAIVAVNAVGDVYDEKTNTIIAGAKDINGQFLDTEKFVLQNAFSQVESKNTTIGCVITNAKVSREQANKLASLCQNGLARSIKPVHTIYDGDTMFVMSTCEKEYDFNALCVAGVEVTKNAILNAVWGEKL